jgi:glycosyltransferase involved in cell wall biosynthesis
LGRAKILFTSTLDLPFIADDGHLLSRHHDVDRLTTRGFFAPLPIFLHLLPVDLSYTWFASTYAFWVVLFGHWLGKRSIIVVGGVDAAKRKDLGYGIWLNPWKSLLVGYAVRRADRVLVVAPALKEQLKKLCGYDGENIAWVPMGFDVTRWVPADSAPPRVITVAACRDAPRLRAKGVDFLVRCAEKMPDVKFTLVGTSRETAFRAGIPERENVQYIPYSTRLELAEHYRSARVYFLPSATEGMPNSLCEAMLCGCIPVATDVGAVGEILGETGFRIRHGDTDAAVRALRSALALPASSGDAARQRILDNFLIARRETELLKTIAEVLG